MVHCRKTKAARPIHRQLSGLERCATDMKNTVVNFSPAWLARHRLTNLWDMITHAMGRLAINLSTLEALRLRMVEEVALFGADAVVHLRTQVPLRNVMMELFDDCKALDLPASTDRAEHLQIRLALGKDELLTYHVIDADVEAVLVALKRELSPLMFAFIPANKAQYAEQSVLFGEAVAKAFPSAASDIKEAGNCVAAGLNTAAVFHLMRVVEFGLNALAADLNIRTIGKKKRKPIDLAMWDEVIWKIEENIGKKLHSKAPLSPAPKTGSRNRASQSKRERIKLHYRGILHEFLGFKDVWRNYVMHTHRSFKEEEAIALLARVREFMQRLATKNF